MSAIEVTNLVKKFHGQTVLHGIDLEVKPGEVVAIIGPSGSGKTTLLRCINLLEQPEAGTIKVGDIIIDTARPFSQQKGLIRQLRQHVGFVFQSFNLFPHRTVLENIIEGPVIVKGEPKAEATALARELLAKVGLAGKETRYPRRLSGGQQQRVAIARALAAVLKLPAIKRMECFDISHTMGEQTVASCVVFDANGPLRAEYRRYNIAGITPGDDYAAMNQVLRRRYGKAIEESKIPDVILIDGGKGQLAQAKAVFAELDVPWDKHRPLLLGVAKGADRKAGLEILFFEPEGEGFSLPPDSPALHVIQHIRDESHDHAIGGHRKKRAKVKNTSTLETIEGVGPKRRQMLLKYMGGLQGLRNASVEEIAKVPGISQGLAEKIFWSLKH